MALIYGIKAEQQGAGANIPHIFSFATARSVSNDTLLEVWNGSTVSTIKAAVDKDGKFYSNALTAGDLIYAVTGGVSNVRRLDSLAIGTAGQFLAVNSGATAPEWTSTITATPLILDQGAADVAVLKFQSSDIATVLTTVTTPDVETDDYGAFAKQSATLGGLKILSLAEDAALSPVTVIESWGGTATSTKSSSGRSLVEIYATEHDGANAQANIAANGNVFGVRARVGAADVTVWLADEDGDSWQGGNATTVTGIRINADDGGAIGASGTAFSDLFLASGAVINFNAGDVTLTHSSNALTLDGGNLLFTDATHDIGALGATRPRNLYISGDMEMGELLWTTSFSATNAPNFNNRRARGTEASPTAVQTNDGLGNFEAYGEDGTGWNAGGALGFIADENWAAGAHGTRMNVLVTPVGASVPVAVWGFQSTGHIIAGADDSYDIGASGANRPRTLYLGTSLIAPSATFTGTVSGISTLTATTLAGTLSTATQNSVTTMTGLVTVGALASGSIASGFGNINNASNTLTTGVLVATTGNFAAGAAANGLIVTTTGTNIVQFQFDSSNVLAIRVSSSGVVTYLATGSGASHTFGTQAVTTGALASTTITGSGILSIDSTTDSTSTTTGSIHTDGGLGVVLDTFLGADLTITDQVTIGGAIEAGSIFNIEPGVAARDLLTSVGLGLHIEADTWDINAAGNGETVAIGSLAFFGIPTWTSVGTTFTVTDAATLYIQGAPVDSTNVTAGSAYALWVDAGATRLDGSLTVGDTPSGDLTVGVTIDQGGNDDMALVLKSSDISHGMTTINTETMDVDDYCTFAKAAAGGGGLDQVIMAEDAVQTILWHVKCYGGQAQATHTTGGQGMIEFFVGEHDGSNALAAMATEGGNIFALRCHDTAGSVLTQFIVDENGQIYANAGTSTNAVTVFDEQNDAQLVRAFDLAQTGKGRVQSAWDEHVKCNEDALVDLGVLGDTVANGGLVCVTQLQRLHNGAIWQAYTERQQMKLDWQRDRDALVGVIEDQGRRIEHLETLLLAA